MGTDDWVLKGTKLTTNTKKQKLKIQSLEFQKYNVKEKKKKNKNQKKTKNKQTKKKQGQKIIKYIYMKFAEEEKNRVFFYFFCKEIGYKSEN